MGGDEQTGELRVAIDHAVSSPASPADAVAAPIPEAEIDWASVFTSAIDAASEVFSARRSEEIVSAGIERVLSGDAPWKPGGKLSLVRHVIAVGFNVTRNERRAASRRRRSDFVAEAARVAGEDKPPAADVAYEDREEREALFAALWNQCEGSPDALSILAAEKKGIMGQTAQLDHCKMTPDAWTIARKHIGRMLKVVSEEGDEAEADTEAEP